MHIGGNDATLREAIERAHALDIDVWLLGGCWTANDFDVAMFCPSQEAVNAWYEAIYCHMARSYGVEGLDVTHARFPMTSYPRGMFICTCEACARSAAELGYDMEAMKADILDAQRRLAAYDGRQLAAIGRDALGAQDGLQLLGVRTGVFDWFRFRCDLLARNVQRFREGVHAAGGEGFIFGIDTYPASLAAFVGHNLSRWDTFSDFASPLVSHVDIFPMQTLVAWAGFLRGLQPTLSEAEALRLVYRFVGYDRLGLPERVADFALGEPDCEYRNIPWPSSCCWTWPRPRCLPRACPRTPSSKAAARRGCGPRRSLRASWRAPPSRDIAGSCSKARRRWWISHSTHSA